MTSTGARGLPIREWRSYVCLQIACTVPGQISGVMEQAALRVRPQTITTQPSVAEQWRSVGRLGQPRPSHLDDDVKSPIELSRLLDDAGDFNDEHCDALVGGAVVVENEWHGARLVHSPSK
jgi:hypothetical protein